MAIRQRAQKRAQERVPQRLYRVQAARKYREHNNSRGWLRIPVDGGRKPADRVHGRGADEHFRHHAGGGHRVRDADARSAVGQRDQQPGQLQDGPDLRPHGQLLWEINDPNGGRRTVVPLAEISPTLVQATLAAEDINYFAHQGFDLRATARSAYITFSGEGRRAARRSPSSWCATPSSIPKRRARRPCGASCAR